MNELLQTIERYRALGIEEQIDYKKFYLYSLITHSTAIEGSTVTEIENQLLFDEGITAPGRTLQEQMMNLDLKAAYEEAQKLADRHTPYSIDLLCRLSAIVMKNTGSVYNTPLGSFSAVQGELRKLNVTAGFGGRSYLAHEKVSQALSDFCRWLNHERTNLPKNDIIAAYRLSFVAHFRLVSIHPWADGNGRMSRLVMNMLQFEFGLIPTKVLKEQKAEYIQALNDTRDQQDESIFPSVMLRLHNTNLQSEINAFVASQETDVPKYDAANVVDDLTDRQQVILETIKNVAVNVAVNTKYLSERLGVNRKTIQRDAVALQEKHLIQWVGSDKTGHWVIIEK